MKNVTVKDVAAAAGVSEGTVMRVIHQRGYVSEKARESVNRAVKELGYIQNQAASILKRQQTNLICHLGTTTMNHNFDRICEGLQQAAAVHGYHVINIPLIYHTDRPTHIVDEIQRYPFDGVVLSSLYNVDEESVEVLQRSKTPTVMLERMLSMDNSDRIYFDDHDASRQAVDYLIGQGCRKIDYVGINQKEIHTNPLSKTELKRLDGYLDTMYQAGLFPRVFNTGDYELASGYHAAEKLLASGVLPEGIVAASDMLACGVLRCFAAHEDEAVRRIRIIGSDNFLARLLPVPIPSIEFKYEEATKAAIEMLITRIGDPNLAPREQKILAELKLNRPGEGEA